MRIRHTAPVAPSCFSVQQSHHKVHLGGSQGGMGCLNRGCTERALHTISLEFCFPPLAGTGPRAGTAGTTQRQRHSAPALELH